MVISKKPLHVIVAIALAILPLYSFANISNDTVKKEGQEVHLASETAHEELAQPQDKKAKVDKIRKLTKDFNAYIEEIKTKITSELERDEDGNLPFEAMDKGDGVDEMWFSGDNPTKAGQEFLDKMANFSADIKKAGGSSISDPEMKKIEGRFATAPVKSKSAGTTLNWLDYNYKGFPLIATVTKLSQIQADIKTTESDIISGMFQSDLVAAASLTV